MRSALIALFVALGLFTTMFAQQPDTHKLNAAEQQHDEKRACEACARQSFEAEQAEDH